MTPQERLLYDFGVEVLRNVAVRTHTNWEVYFMPLVKKYAKRI